MPAKLKNSAVATGLEKVRSYSILKKGNAKECSNYCTIALISHASQFSSVQSLSCVQLFAPPWTAACQASLFVTNSQSLLNLMSIESVMPSNHLVFCHPLLLLPSIFASIRVFSNESVLHIRWPKSHTSKVMLKILQARLQQYLNSERPDIQAGFRKGRRTRE